VDVLSARKSYVSYPEQNCPQITKSETHFSHKTKPSYKRSSFTTTSSIYLFSSSIYRVQI